MDPMGLFWSLGTSPVPVVAAFFIGLMTAINPCTLGTNLVATAFVSNRIGSTRHTFLAGCVYTLGRMVAYVAVAAAIVLLGINVQFIALGLQHYGSRLLGPFLILCGLLLLWPISSTTRKFPGRFSSLVSNLSLRLAEKGYAGAFLIGVIFGLSFCPFSAVLFFGMLIPLSLSAGDPVIIPTSFAIATGLPVIVFSCAITGGAGRWKTFMEKIGKSERIIRYAVAGIFIAAGAYSIVIVYGGI
jgi:sulfite exporter TauE/SafE